MAPTIKSAVENKVVETPTVITTEPSTPVTDAGQKKDSQPYIDPFSQEELDAKVKIGNKEADLHTKGRITAPATFGVLSIGSFVAGGLVKDPKAKKFLFGAGVVFLALSAISYFRQN